MYFDSVQAFLAMGGHGVYVWLAYGATAAALGLLAIRAFAAHSRVLRDEARRQRRAQVQDRGANNEQHEHS